MGLFSKKKRDVSRLPELPKFDDFMRETNNPILKNNKLPKYESAFSRENLAHDMDPIIETSPFRKPQMADDLHIPTREPAFVNQKQNYTERINDNQLDNIIPKNENKQEIKSPFKPEMTTTNVPTLEPKFESYKQENDMTENVEDGKIVLRKQFKVPKRILDERPVFVQIDNYKDAMNNIEVLKQKIREVEYILDKLNEIKSQEQLEMSNCETSLNKIKERLIEIDKKLFEI